MTLYPKTGRTHQIRVHLAAIGHPVMGDKTYGATGTRFAAHGISRTLLHAEHLEVRHPESGRPLRVKADWPADFSHACELLRKGLAAALLSVFFAGAVVAAPAETPVRKPPRPAGSSTGAPASNASSATAGALRALKKDVAGIEKRLDSLTSQLNAIQIQIQDLGVERRFQEADRAVADLNAKAVTSAASAEEAKAQAAEASRKVKLLADALEQMRDRLDRLQREVIQRRASEDGAGESLMDPSDTGRAP